MNSITEEMRYRQCLCEYAKQKHGVIVLLLFSVFGLVITSYPLILCAGLLILIVFLSKSAFVNALSSPNQIPV